MADDAIGQQEELNRPASSSKRPALLVLVRHGQSVRNAAKGANAYFSDAETRDGLRGEPDHMTSLTPDGLAEARATGALLRTSFGSFDYLYHSGYHRTIQTAHG